MVDPLPHLRSVDNFRDVGGIGGGYEVPGGRMRRGVLYRANRVQPDGADLAFLESLGLTAIHDLRTTREIERHPDHPVAGASWRHHEITGAARGVVDALSTPADTVAMMLDIYRGFVTDPARRAGFGDLLRTIAATDGPQLFHCAAGKDRTGWAAWLLHHLAGVPEEAALADYLLTDEYAVGSRAATLESVGAEHGPERAPIVEPAYRCDEAYLEAALGEVSGHYGSLDRYLTDGLGLLDSDLDRLRARLVA